MRPKIIGKCPGCRRPIYNTDTRIVCNSGFDMYHVGCYNAPETITVSVREGGYIKLPSMFMAMNGIEEDGFVKIHPTQGG